jgi:hypothetical protein
LDAGAYGPLDRLTAENITGTTVSGSASHTYDAVGNRSACPKNTTFVG